MTAMVIHRALTVSSEPVVIEINANQKAVKPQSGVVRLNGQRAAGVGLFVVVDTAGRHIQVCSTECAFVGGMGGEKALDGRRPMHSGG